MKTSDVVRQGGIVPVSAAGVNDMTMVATMAKSAQLLGNRTVVKLIAEQLTQAEKLIQEFLGLEPGLAEPVGAALTRAVGFPAWPILQDPPNARHALNLVADVEWAKRMAQGSPGKVADRFTELATELANAAPHFLPTLYEELARIFDSVSNTKYASRYFSKAREVERTYGLTVDPQRHQAVFMEFSQRGTIAAKELSEEAAACIKRADDPAHAYRYFLELNIVRIKAGGAPYAMMVRDLVKLGKAAGMSANDVCVELINEVDGASGLRRAPAKFFSTVSKHIAPAVKENPAILNTLFSQKSDEISLDEWVTAAKNAGLFDYLAHNPERLVRWVEDTLNNLRGIGDNSEVFNEFILAHSNALKGATMTVQIEKINLEIFDCLVQAGASWNLRNASREEKLPHLWKLRQQINRSGHNGIKQLPSLTAAFSNDELCEQLLQGWDLKDFLQNIAHPFAKHGYENIVHYMIRKNIGSFTGQSGTSNKLFPAVEKLTQSINSIQSLKLPCDLLEMIKAAVDFAPEDILAENLRAGLLTELAWPELERHVSGWLSAVAPKGMHSTKVQLKESFPGVVVIWGRKVAAIEGDKTLREGKILKPRTITSAGYLGADHSIFVTAQHHYSNFAQWVDGDVVQCKTQNDYWWRGDSTGDSTSSVPLNDGRLCPSGMVHVGDQCLTANNEGRVFTTSTGQAWLLKDDENQYHYSYYMRRAHDNNAHKGFVVDSATGNVIGPGLPQPLIDMVAGVSSSATPDFDRSTLLALPAGIELRDVVVPVHEGNFVCAAGTDTKREMHYFVATGDGKHYGSDVPINGVIQANGITWLHSPNGELHCPNFRDGSGELAATRNDRGEIHWLHRLPWTAWVNLRVRDAEASARLREVTPEQAKMLLDTLVGVRQVKPVASADRKVSDVKHVGTYDPISEDCRPDSAAMKMAASILGIEGPAQHYDLCASMVQLALQVAKHNFRVERLNKKLTLRIARRKREEESAAASETTQPLDGTSSTHVEHTEKVDNRPKFTTLAAKEARQLADIVHKKPGTRSKQWRWLPVVGIGKSFAIWAQGPLAHPLVKLHLAEMFSVLLDAGICSPAWNQASVKWETLARHYGKSHIGLSFKLSDADDAPRAIMLNRSHSEKKLLIEGEIPDAIHDVAVTGTAVRGKEFGLSTTLSQAEMQKYISLLSSEDSEIDIEAWKESVASYITAIASRCVLTERAVLVLLAGGYHPGLGKAPILFTDYTQNSIAYEQDKERSAAIRKKLKISLKNLDTAVEQLDAVDGELLELLLVAVSDKNMDAVIAIAEQLPSTKIMFDDAQFDHLLGWGNSYYENKVAAIWKAANPLQQRLQLKGGYGYGRIAGTLLHWATYADADDPLREFYADQLERLKTVDSEMLTHENLTTLPLQGTIVDTDYEGYYWQSNNDNGDAVRALKEGLFNPVIAGLRRKLTINGTMCNPQASAPEVVSAVVDKLGISEASAAYFLQILCLVDCSDAKVKSWNGWKKKELDAARAELVEHGLVIEAKRARTGRSVFLPGTWWEASAPNPAMEAWKAVYYAVRFDGKAFSVVPWCPPILPIDELFAAAWERYASGDVPKMEELTTKKYRKRGR